jgi:protein TonB
MAVHHLLPHPRVALEASPPQARFASLTLVAPVSRVPALSKGFSLSLVFHGLLVAAVTIVPLLYYQGLPDPEGAVRAFFVAPLEIAPPPPPPPPPARAASARPPRAVPSAPSLPTASFVAPIEIPDELPPETMGDFGVEGGVPGGVEGGVPGGVLGGVVGGLLNAPPAPAPVKVVRIGGAIVAPKVVRRVAPVYPLLAVQARVQGIVVIEAQVGVNGYVKTARVLTANQILEEAALDAVRQWRYQPLLLNGEPTEFILTVTITFNLMDPTATRAP